MRRHRHHLRFPRHTRRSPDSRGVALVLTLLIVAMLTVLVVGFNATTRTEQMAARNYVYQVVADEMAKSATQEAVSALQTALEGSVASGFVSAPGQIIPMGGGAPVSLFSSNTTDITTPQSTDTEFGAWVTGAPLLRPGFIDTKVTNSKGPEVVGRYAFFVDDETTKISLNSASSGRAPDGTNFFARPYDIRVVPPLESAAGKLAGYVSGTGVMSPSFFFMPRQARALNPTATDAEWDLWLPTLTTVQDTRLNATFRSDNQDNLNALWSRTPWGAERVDLNNVPISDAGVNQIAAAITNSRLTSLFTTTNGAVRGFATKYPNLTHQISANMLMLKSPWWNPGYFSNSVDENFEPPPELADALPLGAPTNAYNVAIQPLPTGGKDMDTAGTQKKTLGIPSLYFGAVPFPMLTEISPSFVYGWQRTPAGQVKMTVRVVLQLEFFNPYPIPYDSNDGSAAIVAQIDKARFAIDTRTGTFWRGPDGSNKNTTPHNDMPGELDLAPHEVWDPWGADPPHPYAPQDPLKERDPANGIKIWPVPSIDARSYATEFIYFDVKFDEPDADARVNPLGIYCIIDSIKILRNGNDPTSIVDWVSGQDFFNALATEETGPAQFQIPLDPVPIFGSFRGGNPDSGGADLRVGEQDAPPAPAPGPGLAKRDPRMRTPLAASEEWRDEPDPAWAWAGNQPASPMAPNPGFLPGNFSNDPLPSDLDYPSDAMQACFAIKGGAFLSLLPSGRYERAEHLGKVFTGAPWRSLSLQAQTEPELRAGLRTPAIPDWVMLDIVSLATPPVAPDIAAVPVNPNAMGRSAGGTLQAVDRVATTMKSLAKPILKVDTNQLSAIANNIARQTWSTKFIGSGTNGWNSVRNVFGLPADTIALPSEIAEISAVADHGTQLLATNETRLSAFYPLVSTTSRFFGIYARGEAISGTNTMAVRQLKTTVEALVDPNSGQVKLERLFTEPVFE